MSNVIPLFKNKIKPNRPLEEDFDELFKELVESISERRDREDEERRRYEVERIRANTDLLLIVVPIVIYVFFLLWGLI
jgi:hypothetical protein